MARETSSGLIKKTIIMVWLRLSSRMSSARRSGSATGRGQCRQGWRRETVPWPAALLATLFLDEGAYPMIDEPTNHLDGPGRALVANYLNPLRR